MVELTKENCDAEVKQAEGLVVVDFWGPQCGPCMALMPAYTEIAEKYKDKAKFCKVDTSCNRRVAINFRVMSLPTILFWKDGAEVARLGGDDATAENITAKVESLIA
ncbi:MAG: thioredoxin [Fretibacterium sp.]|nr:thioredoxin [Fretibacterium sp.]